MAREKHNSASILLMSAAFAAGFGLLLFSSANQPRGPIERLGKQFEARLIVAPRWISGENVSRGASKAPGSLQGRPYLLHDGQPVIEALGQSTLLKAMIATHLQGERLYQGVFGPAEYYPRRIYFFIELGPQLLPIRLEEPLRRGLQEHLIVK